MKHLKSFNENHSLSQHNQNYRELADILQSEVLDDYDIYKDDCLTERGALRTEDSTNEPCWLYNHMRVDSEYMIAYISIYARNRWTKEGKETLKKISKDIELLKNSISNFLGIEFEIEDHTTSLVIVIKDTFYDECV